MRTKRRCKTNITVKPLTFFEMLRTCQECRRDLAVNRVTVTTHILDEDTEHEAIHTESVLTCEICEAPVTERICRKHGKLIGHQ